MPCRAGRGALRGSGAVPGPSPTPPLTKKKPRPGRAGLSFRTSQLGDFYLAGVLADESLLFEESLLPDFLLLL